MMINSINNKAMNKRILIIITAAVISLALLIAFSWSTSFIFNDISTDSDTYKLMGRMIIKGKVPYKDFFDHKGPFLMFLMYISYGVWNSNAEILFLQWIAMLITLLALYKTLELFIQKKEIRLLGLVVCALVYIAFLDSGNVVEEYCVPFLAWSQFFATKYLLKKDNSAHNTNWSLLYGITFSICAFTRLTNALPLCVSMAVIVCLLLYNKQWKNLLLNALKFIIGILVVFIPVSIWFYYNNAFEDMIHATFIYNFNYMLQNDLHNETKEIIFCIARYLSLICVAFAVGIIHLKKQVKVSIVILLQSLLCIYFQINSALYPHYLLVYAPMVSLSFMILVNDIREKKWRSFRIIVMIAFCILVIGNYGFKTSKSVRLLTNSTQYEARKEALEIKKRINPTNRDKIIGYNIPSFFN